MREGFVGVGHAVGLFAGVHCLAFLANQVDIRSQHLRKSFMGDDVPVAKNDGVKSRGEIIQVRTGLRGPLRQAETAEAEKKEKARNGIMPRCSPRLSRKATQTSLGDHCDNRD